MGRRLGFKIWLSAVVLTSAIGGTVFAVNTVMVIHDVSAFDGAPPDLTAKRSLFEGSPFWASDPYHLQPWDMFLFGAAFLVPAALLTGTHGLIRWVQWLARDEAKKTAG